MSKFHRCSTLVVLLLALLSFGCSHDNPSTPQPLGNPSPDDDALKVSTFDGTIRGWVQEWDGSIPPVGTKVTIQVATIYDYPTYIWVTDDSVKPKTDEDGYFEVINYFLNEGLLYRCLCLGDISDPQQYDGIDPILTYYLVGLKPTKVPGQRTN